MCCGMQSILSTVQREEIIHTWSEVFCTMHFMFAVEKRLSPLCSDVSFSLAGFSG